MAGHPDTFYTVDELDTDERALIEREYGGSLEDVDVVGFWRKYSDLEEGGYEWSGWPLRNVRIVKIDDPDNWKRTWFLIFFE